MFSTSKSKLKDIRAGKESQMTTSKPSGHMNAGSRPVSGYSSLLGKFHALDISPDETDDETGPLYEYSEVFNSGEYEETKGKTSNQVRRQESIPAMDHDKGEKIRQKNEKKHQRQKEKRAQELYEKCCSFLMSRKLETLAQQLVAMGFSADRATMSLIITNGKIEQSIAWLLESTEESDHPRLKNGNLKIDISEELNKIADMGVRYNCSKQEVERAVIACQGDLEYAAETLRRLNHCLPLMSEETLQKPTPQLESEETLAVAQNSLRGKETLSVAQNWRAKETFAVAQKSPRAEETLAVAQKSLKAKETLAVAQNSLRAEETLAVAQKSLKAKDTSAVAQNSLKAKETLAVAQNSLRAEETLAVVQKSLKAEETLAVAQNSLRADPRQHMKEEKYFNYAKAVSVNNVTLPKDECAKPLTLHGSLENNELKNLQFGSVKQHLEPIAVMQRPQSSNLDHAASGWPRTNNNNYTDVPFQEYRQFDGLLNYSDVGRALSAAASSLDLFSGLGLGRSNSSSSCSSPVDWHFSDLMFECDYTNVDWRCGTLELRMSGMWESQNNYQHYNQGFDTQAGKRMMVASDEQIDEKAYSLFEVARSGVEALFSSDDSSCNWSDAGAGAGQIGGVVNSGVEALYTSAGSSWNWSAAGAGAGQIGGVVNSGLDAFYPTVGSSCDWSAAGAGAGQIGGVVNSGLDAFYPTVGSSCDWSAGGGSWDWPSAGAGVGGYCNGPSAGAGGYSEWSTAGAGQIGGVDNSGVDALYTSAGSSCDLSAAGAGGGSCNWPSAGAGVGGYNDWSSAGGYREWSTPFEGKDLFSHSRQLLVSSPSLL